MEKGTARKKKIWTNEFSWKNWKKASPLFVFHFKYKWTYIDKYYLIKNLVLIPFLFFNSCVTNSCNPNTKSFQFLCFRSLWFSHFPHSCVFFVPTFFSIPVFSYSCIPNMASTRGVLHFPGGSPTFRLTRIDISVCRGLETTICHSFSLDCFTVCHD
jgi:hypothetical protein